MEILKHGNTKKPARFTCQECGCMWIADNEEYTVRLLVGGRYPCMACPDCGIDIKGHYDHENPLIRGIKRKVGAHGDS